MSNNVNVIINTLEPLSKAFSLTPNEKQELLQKLNVLFQATDTPTSTGTNKNQSFSVGGNLSLSGQGNVNDLSLNMNEAGGNIDASKRTSVTTQNNTQQQDVLAKLEKLHQQILESQEINAAHKTVMDAPAEGLKKELSKKEPDKGLVKKFVDALVVGLKGVKTLASPVTEVAKLIAAAWAD